MQRGCVSLGEAQCDECHRIIPYPERYLIVEETGGSILRLCVDCSVNKGYASYKQEKGEQLLTFLAE